MGAARRRSRLVTTLAIGGFAVAAPAAGAAAPAGLSAKAASQIASLQRLKSSWTAREHKLDSRLAVALRQRADKSAGLPRLSTGVAVTKADTTEVDLLVTAVSGDLLRRLGSVGAHVRSFSKRGASIRAELPMSALESVAGWKDVRRIGLAVGHFTAHETLRPAESKQAKAARLDAQLSTALAAP
jgi:hypothetical protein